MVYLDPGHGGCLDWGVLNPFDNTLEKAEKTITLRIGLLVRERLAEAGVGVVMSRHNDEPLAGDRDAEFGCTGAPFRDVNGDGQTGFDAEGYTMTRDEQTARIDRANLVRADVLVSIHVNSIADGEQVYEIAATETFYTDEVPWASHGERLARQVQGQVVDALGAVAPYDRQDRGVKAVNYYIIAPPLTDPGPDEPEPRKRPRGIHMPGVLAEVGSVSLQEESELLATSDGQAAVADGLFAALREYFASRPWAVRYDALLPGGEAGRVAPAEPGSGPPFSAPVVSPTAEGVVRFPLQVTNTGNRRWPAELRLAVGWQASEDPYLAVAPLVLSRHDVPVPPLRAGESVFLPVELEVPEGDARHVAWVTLEGSPGDFADLGSPALQLATRR